MTRRIPAAPTSRRRVLRATLLTPVLGMALAGCQWTSPIQTEKQYEPSDGRSVALGNDVNVNNMLVVTDKKGGQGTLVGLGVNNSNQPVQVTFTVPQQQPLSIDIKPHNSQQISEPKGGRANTIASVPVAPGSLLDVVVASSGAGSQTIQVPVVAPYPPYGDFHSAGPVTPSAGAESGGAGHETSAPTATSAATPTQTPTASSTASPAESPTPTAGATSTN
ncbi:hypothetical protein [Mobilicoccus pelagius]|uniref:Lipoprotein n=1 Tax=Mobilicoccus pelagius NBRC 104925 TaxID=1089455 RepID=H5UN62_9MICO|nr:hypothetical protein [Mobilicoccus pelagius]GAB47170.1 hypothetical protein MOPEL_005_00320 [Mobilicoccus pelagius NBRC 104925]